MENGKTINSKPITRLGDIFEEDNNIGKDIRDLFDQDKNDIFDNDPYIGEDINKIFEEPKNGTN